MKSKIHENQNKYYIMRKKTITLLAILLCSTALFAQNITYSLSWNSTTSQYELYVKRDVTAAAPVTTGGTSAVTIVFPTDGVDGTRTLTHTSESVSSYNAAGVIRAPGAASNNDFYVFNSTGGASYIGVLDANVEVLWMTFTASDGNNQARLFENDSDPSSTDTGMMGINAKSEFFTITTAGANDEFSMNVLGVETTELQELSIYPNPASTIVNITSNNSIDSVNIYDMLGKKVMAVRQTRTIDVSGLNSGVYLFKITSGNNVQTKKVVVE